MRFFSGIVGTSILLYLAAQLLFLVHVRDPRQPNFDEFHYVPAAKQWLALEDTRNWEHPPLGKELMAIGIGWFGDEPLGWRFMSTVFGALTLVGMYAWGWVLFRRKETALLVAILSAANFLLYVQSRIGMLDTFMMAFLVWGLAAFCATWTVRPDARDPRRLLRLHAFAGAMFGLATACKWAAIVPWFFCVGLYFALRVIQGWRVRMDGRSDWASKEPEFEEWYGPELWKGFHGPQLVLCYGIIPLAAYFATFLPFLWVHHEPAYTLRDLVLMQPRMWSGQLRVVNTHPYMSQWWEWPLMLRPIWYTFTKDGEQSVRAVILLGNPLLMWGGLIAWAVCLWGWLKHRSRAAFLIAILYAVLTFSWAVIPRKIAFYYYYYPSGMVLSLAIAYVFQRFEDARARVHWARWAFAGVAVALFAYFFPILAGLRIDQDAFRQWMWLSRWV